jgi:hypothetical protein
VAMDLPFQGAGRWRVRSGGSSRHLTQGSRPHGVRMARSVSAMARDGPVRLPARPVPAVV